MLSPVLPATAMTSRKPLSAADRSTREDSPAARREIANRLFFRLYQCANLMHKTGTRALEAHGVTTQQWAILGALSRPGLDEGMAVGELVDYLKVSRQNLTGIVDRLEKLGFLQKARDPTDGRSRRVRLTGAGQDLWRDRLTPAIAAYYGEATAGISTDDLIHACHYLNRLMDNFLDLEGR
jgi:DNA-binding MarR family transcriptional regulator